MARRAASQCTTTLKDRLKKRQDFRLRRNPKNERPQSRPPQEPPDEDRFFVIEKLLDKRYAKDGHEEYLVRWQNYSPAWDSWEPRSELELNALDMINEYNRVFQSQILDKELHCICRQPYRFQQGGMIQCFNCLTWYHFTCLEMDMEEANSYSKYFCTSCREVNPNFKNTIKLNKLNTFYGKNLAKTLA